MAATACSANPYHYAANNPVGMADPLGLRPVTEAELQEYRDGMNRNVWQQAGDFVSDNWEYIAAGAMIVVGVGLMFTGVGGPAGVAIMAASGGLISAGASAGIQRFTTGEVNWGQVAVAGVTGAAAGGLGFAAGAYVNGASALARASPFVRGAVVGATENVVGGAAGRGLTGQNPFDPTAMGTDLLIGGGVGGVGGHLGDASRVDPPPRFSGTEKPWTTGATPDSIYTHVDPVTGAPKQNAIYNADGDVIGHVDFKQHGPSPPGHGHMFPEPGNPASGHGPGNPHYDPEDLPPGWGDVP